MIRIHHAPTPCTTTHARPSLPVNQDPILTTANPGPIRLHDTAAILLYIEAEVKNNIPTLQSIATFKLANLNVSNHCHNMTTVCNNISLFDVKKTE